MANVAGSKAGTYARSEIIGEAHRIGPGVNELRVRVGAAFRVICVAKFAEAVYVLHAFQKKSQRTARLDIELARSRFNSLMNERRAR